MGLDTDEDSETQMSGSIARQGQDDTGETLGDDFDEFEEGEFGDFDEPAETSSFSSSAAPEIENETVVPQPLAVPDIPFVSLPSIPHVHVLRIVTT